jgi:glycosidase
MKIKFKFRVAVTAALAGVFSILPFSAVAGGLATVWHIPDNTSDVGVNMRSPEFAIGTSSTVTFYTGVWKVDTGNGNTVRCNQTGGTLYYKTAAQSSWSSKPLMFYSNTSANQYWFTNVNGSQFSFGDTVQYFFLLTFDGSGSAGSTNTWLYGNNAGSSTTGSSNAAAASPFTFAVTNANVGTPVLTVNGVNADYTESHVFVNELNNDAVPFTMILTPNADNVTNAEIFSNLNRRDRATQLWTNALYPNGVESGIVSPDGNQLVAGDDGNYWKAYTMTNIGGGQYSLTLNAAKTGAYRITARYKVAGNPNWLWYNSANGGSRRDHAVVVTPARARDISMYELNAMNICAGSPTFDGRSTFTDLYGGPGARPYDAVTNRFNLSYAQNLGINWLWFQPIHPIGLVNRATNPATGQIYDVGSPYSIKNFFQVNPLMSKANTREAAMQEFTNFVNAAHGAGINVMLDEPFNHTSWDCELDNAGTNYFAPGANPTNVIMNSEARVYSRSGEYDQRAYSAASAAVAPDRTDFGKWPDVADIYFGRYDALVANSSQQNYRTNEGDWFDYSINKTNGVESGADDPNAYGDGHGHFDKITQNVWRYFSDSVLYWLDKTGCPQGTPANQTYAKGIDGLRADFGQGLPPQCWEYIINKVRSRKWDFVFMTESLDGGQVTYRSSRHFDVLNESLLQDLKNAATAGDYRNDFEARRAAYGQSVVLLNNTSHDEAQYPDPFQALIRYAACATIDGAPMIFYGQELGIAGTNGFNNYELNFSKMIPQFKTYNSLQPILTNRSYGVDFLWPVYSAINQARNFSPALRSSNRYFLDQQNGSGAQPSIFSVAKYVTANGAPNLNDVVFAFSSLDRNNAQSGWFNVNITQNGSNLFGIKPGRIYNVKNISAYTAWDANRRNYWLWPNGGTAGSNVLASGIYVGLNAVPSSDSAWTNAPFEAQYLKLYDVTPPPALASAPTNSSGSNYVFGISVTFTWPAVADAEGGISGYHLMVGTTPGGSNVFNGIVSGTSYTVTGAFGTRLFATVTAVNNAGIESAPSTGNGISLLNPAWTPTPVMGGNKFVNWASVSGQVYQVWSTTNLLVPFAPFGGSITAAAPSLVFTNNPTNSVRYFKIQWLPQ